MSQFELYRRRPAVDESRRCEFWNISDVVEDIGSCIASGRLDPTTDALALEQLQEALD